MYIKFYDDKSKNQSQIYVLTSSELGGKKSGFASNVRLSVQYTTAQTIFNQIWYVNLLSIFQDIFFFFDNSCDIYHKTKTHTYFAKM